MSTPSERDFAEAMADCMAQRGWKVEIRGDGGIEAEFPTSQQAQFDVDHDECMAAGGYDQPPPPFTEESAARLVADMHDAAECLREHDYEVPDPPTDAQTVEGLMSPDRNPGWDIYGTVPDGTALSDAQALCDY